MQPSQVVLTFRLPSSQECSWSAMWSAMLSVSPGVGCSEPMTTTTVSAAAGRLRMIQHYGRAFQDGMSISQRSDSFSRHWLQAPPTLFLIKRYRANWLHNRLEHANQTSMSRDTLLPGLHILGMVNKHKAMQLKLCQALISNNNKNNNNNNVLKDLPILRLAGNPCHSIVVPCAKIVNNSLILCQT